MHKRRPRNSTGSGMGFRAARASRPRGRDAHAEPLCGVAGASVRRISHRPSQVVTLARLEKSCCACFSRWMRVVQCIPARRCCRRYRQRSLEGFLRRSATQRSAEPGGANDRRSNPGISAAWPGRRATNTMLYARFGRDGPVPVILQRKETARIVSHTLGLWTARRWRC